MAVAFCGGASRAHEGHVHAEEKAAAAKRGGDLAGPRRWLSLRAGRDRQGRRAVDLPRRLRDECAGAQRARRDRNAGRSAGSGAPGWRVWLDAPFFAKPGRHDLVVTVSDGQTTEILPISLDIAANVGTHPAHGLWERSDRRHLSPFWRQGLSARSWVGCWFCCHGGERMQEVALLALTLAVAPGSQPGA